MRNSFALHAKWFLAMFVVAVAAGCASGVPGSDPQEPTAGGLTEDAGQASGSTEGGGAPTGGGPVAGSGGAGGSHSPGSPPGKSPGAPPGMGSGKSPGGSPATAPYALAFRPSAARHREQALGPDGSAEVLFAWNDEPGLVPPADLSVEWRGEPALQVFSSDGRPMARAGLETVGLEPRTTYRLSAVRENDSLLLTLAHARAGVALGGDLGIDLRVRLAVEGDPNEASLDFVLPAEGWRSAVVSPQL